MEQGKNILLSLDLVVELTYYLNTRDDPQAWEFADALQGKLDKVYAREAYGRRLKDSRLKAIDEWLEATDVDIHFDDEQDEEP